LEYEQRLKTHLYQFEDDDRKKNLSIDDSQASDHDRQSHAYNRDTPAEDVLGNTKMSQNQV